MKSRVKTARVARPARFRHLVICTVAIGGLVLFCLGARALMTGATLGPVPALIPAVLGGALMALAAYLYYVVDFKGRGGLRAFILKMTAAAAAGFFSMLIARLISH